MDESVMKTYARAEETFVDGQGAVVTDNTGREFLDFLAGIAVSALGHGHPRVTAALHDQIDKVVHVSNLFRHSYTEQVAQRLCQQTGMDRAFFTNSGAESVECALKIARKTMHVRGTPDRTAFVAIEGGFHGRTLGALSLTHTQKYRAPFAPLLDVTWVAAEDEAALSAALDQQRPAALVMEPIQGEGGLRELSPAYLQRARHLCDQTGTILIHDEIQSGCGRTGRFLAGQHNGVIPDIVTLAKPLAAGLPMGACLARGDCATALQPGEHGTTFGGGPLVCRAALVFLDAIDDGLLEDVEARGATFRAGLEQLAADLDVALQVRGRGLMLGLQLRHSAADAQRELYRRGLIANCTAGDVLRFLPPFVVTEDQIQHGLGLLREVLTEINQKEAP